MTDFTKVIPPGSEGKISASVNLSHGKGPIEKYVTVTTNDPARAQFKLTLKADLKDYVEIQPTDQVRFTVSTGESATQELILTPGYKDPIHLKDPVSSSDILEATLTPSGPENNKEQQYTLKLTLKDNVKVGNQNMTVRLTAEGSPQSEISIPVFALVKGPIAVNPAMITFVLKSYPEEVATTGAADLKQQAEATSPSAISLPVGTALRVINQTPQWYQVITQPSTDEALAKIANRVGWVLKSITKVTKEAPDAAPQTVELKKNNGQPFKVLSYSVSLPDVKAEMVPGGAGRSYTLRLTLGKVTKKAQTVPGALQVKTDDPEQPDVSVPVYLIVS